MTTAKRESINTNKSNSNSKLGLLVLGVGILTSINLIVSLFFGTISLGTKSQNMVQLENGKTIAAREAATKERSSPVVRSYVEKIMTGLYTMDGYLPRTSIEEANNPTPDPGIEIKNSEAKITTAAWEASFGLDLKLRQEILDELAGITPKSVFNQKKSVVFVPNYIGEPVSIPGKPGYWTINLVSTLVAFEAGEQLGEVIPNNKKIYIRAVIPPDYKEFTTPVAQIIANVRASGLEIYHITDLTREELEQSTL